MGSNPATPRKRKRNRRQSNGLKYGQLEDRRVLATIVSFNAGTGALDVQLTAMDDVAVIDISNGNVSVNGSEDVDTLQPGSQIVAFTALRSIQIQGDISEANQLATLQGDYSIANGARLQSISILGLDNVTIGGTYDLASFFTVTLAPTGGQISDGGVGQVSVAGVSTFDVGDGSMFLNNSNHDFVGNINVVSTGTDQFVVLADANDIQFGDVTISGELVVTVSGDITDSAGATIEVGDAGRFTGNSVILGDQPGDTTRFGTLHATTLGRTELNSESAVILGDIRANELTIRTPLGIFDGRRTIIEVASTATFDGGTRVRIGDNGSDSFNAGSLNVNSNGYVSIWENSGTHFTGSNTALSLDLISTGAITDNATSQINITNIAGFEGQNIVLGDEASDQFNAGALYFYTPGDFSVSEDSGIHIIETKNQARNLTLISTATITDANDSQIVVESLAMFDAASLNLGDSNEDVFHAGSIQFTTSGQFKLSEDSGTNLVGSSSAQSSLIESSASITNVFVGTGGTGTNLEIQTVASFTGLSILLGEQENDNLDFGSLRLNTPGEATVTEDSDTHLALASQVGQLNLTSAGAITDALTGSLNVSGIANLVGTSIRLGETDTDEFNAQSLTVDAGGIVDVTEDSALNLAGVNRAGSLTLVANGTLTDSLTTDTLVSGLLNVTGTLINLGSETTDFLQAAELRFNSTGNSNITSDANVVLSGTSFAGNQLILTTIGNLIDAESAETRAQNRATLTGVDVILGEGATDCFDIIDGGESNLFVTATGTKNVVVGC